MLLQGCSGAILSLVGPVGSAEQTILLNSLAIMLAIVIPTILATLTCAWWFRASNRRARYLPTWAYSGRIELIVWSIPALVVFFLGGIGWIGSDLDPARPLSSSRNPLEIDVVSLDWKWLFIYPDEGVASVNQLVAPVGLPLHLRITSATVLNVFFVPRLGSEPYVQRAGSTISASGNVLAAWRRTDDMGARVSGPGGFLDFFTGFLAGPADDDRRLGRCTQ